MSEALFIEIYFNPPILLEKTQTTCEFTTFYKAFDRDLGKSLPHSIAYIHLMHFGSVHFFAPDRANI